MVTTRAELIAALNELIAALDRRLPGRHESEAIIVSESAVLRNRAVARLAQLSVATSTGRRSDPHVSCIVVERTEAGDTNTHPSS
jgi:hypothetical protein